MKATTTPFIWERPVTPEEAERILRIVRRLTPARTTSHAAGATPRSGSRV